MYISANLPERYGVFESIRKDNYPFNQAFAQYIELIARIGTHHKLDIIETIGFIEDGIMGEERLPDIPEGDASVQFRFKTENPLIQQYYQAQETSNRQVTMLIIMMTLRLSERYGTSLYRIQSRIDEISELPKQKKRVDRVAKPVDVEKPVEVVKPRPQVKIKKKRLVPVEPKEVVEEEPKEVVEEEPKEVIAEEPKEESTESDTEDIVSRLERLTNQGKQLLDTKDEEQEEEEDVVVKTNPALGDFFSTD